ncbi:hypothetical protein [Hoeflea ulvae]|uniref:Phage baseplate protein n=1 Tax=Hoeflea ulvae TaxID=2983764 RepID=A0ABT3YKZ4_9HYPH|nr:hypothetical protein [Hoeflea ulvae]MCY0096578.1 hypothetical protein [Hoeflea ulvae]
MVGAYPEPAHSHVRIDLQARLDCIAAMIADENAAARTSRLISVLFEDIAESQADRLSSNQRQVRLLQKALELGRWPAHFVTTCRHCKVLSDVTVSRQDFQDSIQSQCPASCQLTLNGQTLTFRAPTGIEEKTVLEDAGLGSAALLGILHVPRDASPAANGCEDGEALPAVSDEDADALLVKILEECSPPVGVLNLDCPSCQNQIRFWFDSIDWISRHVWSAIDEVTVLARAFGWTEEAICALPQSRRELYLKEARGMVQ